MDTKMNDIVLVPTDFSEVCANAINQAVEAAKFLNFKVYLLHVINSDTRAYLKKNDAEVAALDEKLKKIAGDIKAEHKEVEVEYLSKEGSIFSTIAEVAKDIGANLIFLGTHGKVGMQHLTGSYALKVVTSSPVPVIVVQKRSFEKGYRNIVLPITSDAGPWQKTKWAVFIAKQFGAKIHIYRIHDASEGVVQAADQIAAYFEKNGVEYTKEVAERSGNFAKQTIDYATASNSDMIMIMTNPDTNFTSFILGTYDEQIIFNTSQIPVMCINPRKFNYEILGF
ncbi:MAG: universal stress protein [Bacteroidales bacterium]|nr:universal stress protein [Bacteroidales bacterium]